MKNLIKSFKNLFYLFSYFWRYGKVLFIVSSLGLLYAPIQTYITIQSIKFTVDSITLGIPFSAIAERLIIYFAILFVLSLYCSVIDNYLWELLTLRITSGIRHEVYEHVVKTDYKYFDNPKFYDDYSWTTDRLSDLTVQAMHIIRTFLTRLFTISTLIALTLSMNWVLLIFVAISLGIGLSISKVKNKINFKKTDESQSLYRSQNYIHRLFYMKDYADEIRTTKLSEIFLKKYDENTEGLINVIKKHRSKLTFTGIILDSQELLFTASCMIYLAYSILFSNLSLGSFSALITASAQLKSTLNQLLGIINEMQNVSLYTDRIKSFFQTKSIIENKKNVGRIPNQLPFSCAVKNLSFRYDESERLILKNINLTIKSNEKIAIVGENGAGKTTLVKLLLRLYEPTSGTIDINGTSIEKYNLNLLRENIGVVFQNSKVYAASVRDNLKIFSTEIYDADILKALESVGIKETLNNMNVTLDSQMTREFDENGLVFSGGQTQLFNIARLFTKNYGLIILDEPSSALDPIKEYELNKIIMKEINNSSVIIISHRLSTVRDADCIYVMEDGSIIERGNHEYLMQLKGKYFEMFNMQAENYIK
jgi:ATP-binding cassette subfamily B protein